MSCLRLRFLSGSELPRKLDVAPPALTRLKRLVGVLSQDARMKSIVKTAEDISSDQLSKAAYAERSMLLLFTDGLPCWKLAKQETNIPGGCAYACLSPSLVEIVVFEVLGKEVSRATLVPAEGFDVKQNGRWAVFDRITGLGAISARGLTRYLEKLTRIYCFC